MAKRKPDLLKALEAQRDWNAKLRTELRLARRGFDAAKSDRLTAGWRLTGGGPNADVKAALPLLRRRHQDLVDNNPWAARAISVIVNNWVGARGILGQPQGGRSSRRARLWTDWSESLACDFYGQQNLAGLQQQWARVTATRGAVLIRKRIEPALARDGLPGLQLQTYEPDHLDASKRGPGIIGGVQFEATGRVAGYWLKQAHPLDSSSLQVGGDASEYVPREDMIHLFEVRRPGQYDGVPWGVSAMLRLRDLDDYDSAKLLKAKISACFVAFVTDATGEPDDSALDIDTLEPGAIETLPPGKTVELASPPQDREFEPFVRHQLHAVAAAYGLSYEALTGILDQVNYSSGRMGWLEFNRNVAVWRWGIMIPRGLQRVAGWFDDVLGTVGQTSRGKWLWTPPRRELLDPQRDIPALIEAVQAGFMSLSEVQRSLGYLPAELLEELRLDLEEARAKGLVLTVDKSRDPNLLFAQQEIGQNDPPEQEGDSPSDT